MIWKFLHFQYQYFDRTQTVCKQKVNNLNNYCSSPHSSVTTTEVDDCDTLDPYQELTGVTSKMITDGTETLDPYLLVYLTCDGEKKWLSGEPARVAQCRNKAWVAVLDICDDGK